MIKQADDKDKKDKQRYHRVMCHAVNLAAVSGTASLTLNFAAGLVIHKTALDRIGAGDYISMLIITLISMLLPILIFKKEYKNLGSLIKPKELPQKSMLLTVLYILAGFGICALLNFGINQLAQIIPSMGVQKPLSLQRNDPIALICMTAALVIAPPICEELLMRGCIQGSLLMYGRSFSVVISAFVFSMLHSGVWGMLFAFLSGLVLGYIRISTGRLAASVAVHILNNLLAFFSLLLTVEQKSVFIPVSLVAEAAVMIGAVLALKMSGEMWMLSDQQEAKASLQKMLAAAGGSPLLWLYTAAAVLMLL